MKVNVDISSEYKETHAVIYADKMTEEVTRAVDLLSGDSLTPLPITAQAEDETVVLRAEDIFLVRIENEKTILYTTKEKYSSRKRLYELSEQLGGGFMQISKSSLVNLSQLDRIEPGFGGAVIVKLKNGASDFVSRKYLPVFKKYLGL